VCFGLVVCYLTRAINNHLFNRCKSNRVLSPVHTYAAVEIGLQRIANTIPLTPTALLPFWHPGTLTLRPERQSTGMSKITNDGLYRSGTGCFLVVPIWKQKASKDYRDTMYLKNHKSLRHLPNLCKCIGQRCGAAQLVPWHEQRHYGRDADVWDETDDQCRHNGDRHVLGRLARLFTRCRYCIEPNVCVETCGSAGHHLSTSDRCFK